MDQALRRAWTEIVSPEDYERHMAAVGQAQAAASLTGSLLEAAALSARSRVTIVGAGTGQLLEYLDAQVLRPYRLTFTDLNPRFLGVLRARLTEHHLEAAVIEDDLEQTRLSSAPDLVLASLVLEHIDWRLGVRALTSLHPRFCGLVLQENPPDMVSAVTPGRELPPSMAEAMSVAHPTLIPRDHVITAMARADYRCRFTKSISVADRKRLVGLLFKPTGRSAGRLAASASPTGSTNRPRGAHPTHRP